MEMRKFIIELHPDGSLSWNEYEDRKERYTHREWNDLLTAALQDVQNILKQHPACTWDENENFIFMCGAVTMQNTLRDLY